MAQTYYHGRFEFFVVTAVIAIVALMAAGRYSVMAEEARILGLQTISHHFMTGASNLRIQFLLAGSANKSNEERQLTIEGSLMYFSSQGWPASVSGPVDVNYRPTDEDCYQFWQQTLQNAAPITLGEFQEGKEEYRVFSGANNCRYEFMDGTAYFDYLPLDGRVIFVRSGININ